MTANGASGETKKQFEQLLGGGMKLDDLNRNYSAMARRLGTDSKLQIANSVWYDKGRINVKKDFLQRNADYFGAGAYQLDFSKAETVGRINSWVKDHTGGKIDKITDKINSDDVMFLINALYFEDEWMRQYDSSRNENFTAPGGTVSAPFMVSTEKLIHDESAEGMIKPFKDERYAFAAILPKESIGLDNYISKLTGDSFLSLIKSDDGDAEFYLPKFKYKFEEELNNPLQEMGLSNAFKPEKADFSSMGASPWGKLVISKVLHKTFIEVDQMGAKAGAVTEVAASTTSAMIDPKIVKFDRPFVYAIIDTQTNLPVFIGTVTNPVQ
jgi:serpin B